MPSAKVLTGSLDFLTLAEILQLLGSNGSTGVLRLASQHAPGPAVVYLSGGNPVDAANGSLTGMEALLSLFGWAQGQFEFHQERVDVKRTIRKGRMEVILDGLRMLDDGQIKRLGPQSGKMPPAPKPSTVPLVQRPFVDYTYVVDEEEFQDGQEVVHEGGIANWTWVILDGAADIVKETPNGRLTILRIGNGTFIGNIFSISSGSMQTNTRSATVTAVGHLHLGVLDSQRLNTEFSCMSFDMRSLLISLGKRLERVTNQAVEIHGNRPGVSEALKDMKVIVAQGADQRGVFKITKGQASIVKNTENGPILLAKLGEGDFLGRAPFMDMGHEPESAAVFATEDFKASALDFDLLQKEYEELPPMFKNIIEHVASCVAVTTMVACDFHKKTVDVARSVQVQEGDKGK